MLKFLVFYMHKKINILLIIALFGLFLLPEQSYACALHSKETVKTEKSCCVTKEHKEEKEQQQHTEESAEKDCCKSKNDDNNKCSGKCGNQSCHSTTFSFSATPPISRNVHCDLGLENKKSYPLYKQNSYSLREFSIWQPPKIS